MDSLPMYEFLNIWEKVSEMIKQEHKEYQQQLTEAQNQKTQLNSSSLKIPNMPKFK